MNRKLMLSIVSFMIVLFLLPGKTMAQTTEPGVRVKEDKEKTFVYEIKVVGLENSALSQYLDTKMKAKYGVVTSQSNFSNGICTVEVVKAITPVSLIQIVRQAGFDVSKTF